MRILRVTGVKQEYVDDEVVEDVLFRIFVNGTMVSSMNVIPNKLVELTYGYLITTGYINKLDEIMEILLDENDVLVKLSKDVDVDEIKEAYLDNLSEAFSIPNPNTVKEPKVNLAPNVIQKVMDELNQRGDIFKQTGGTHSALIYQKDEMISFSEDVGRFNALDKVIGEALKNKIDLRNVILATSGRLAGEMVLKASNAGIPVMCSVSAPMSSGVNIAKSSGMTLIGFARQNRYNVYSGFERMT